MTKVLNDGISVYDPSGSEAPWDWYGAGAPIIGDLTTTDWRFAAAPRMSRYADLTSHKNYVRTALGNVSADWVDVSSTGIYYAADADDLQDAIDKAEAAGGGVVEILEGTYTLSTGLTIENGGVILRGRGKGTILRASAAITLVTVNPGLSNSQLNVIEKLRLDLNSVAGANGLYLQSGGQLAIARDLAIYNLNNGYGVKTNSHSNINNVGLAYVRVMGMNSSTGNGFEISADATVLTKCDFVGGSSTLPGTGYGFVIGNALDTVSGVTLNGCEAAWCAVGVRLSPTASPNSIVYGLSINGMRIEGTSSYAMYLKGYNITYPSKGVAVINPYLATCTKGIYVASVHNWQVIGGVYKDTAATDGGVIDLGTPTGYTATYGGTVIPGALIGTTPALMKPSAVTTAGLIDVSQNPQLDAAFTTGNSGAITIRDFYGAYANRVIRLIINDANTTVSFTSRRLAFDAGVTAISVGNTVTGLTSGASGVVVGVLLLGGAWASGTAEGYLYFDTITGTFSNNEALQVSAVTRATANGTAVAPLYGNAAANWSPGVGDHLTAYYNGTSWFCDIADNTA